MRLNVRDTRERRLDEAPPGGTLNVVDRVGLRNSVRNANFDLLVLQSSMRVRRTLHLATRNRNSFQIDI